MQQREIEDVCAGKEGGKLPLFVDSEIVGVGNLLELQSEFSKPTGSV